MKIYKCISRGNTSVNSGYQYRGSTSCQRFFVMTHGCAEGYDGDLHGWNAEGT